MISGPTTAISIVVFTSISHFAEPGSAEFIRMALTLTFLAGVYQLALGLARMGALVNFVSHSVIVGFTSGAAILIGTSQMKHVFGLEIPRGSSFLQVWLNLLREIGHINPYVIIVALITLVFAVLFKVFLPRWPGMLFAMIIGSLVCLLLSGEQHGVHLLGQMPAHLPPLSLPDFSFDVIRELAPKALAVALLGLIEALSIGRSISTKSRQQIDGSQEFIGQGLSNVVGSFFSSYAGSGSFTRSGINYQAGAMTPLSAVFSAVFLSLLLLLIAPLTAYLPIAAMGGIILLVAYSLIDIAHIRSIFRTSWEETAVLLATFFATLFLELEFAIYAGVLLSLILYLNRTAHPRIANLAPNRDIPGFPLMEKEAECLNLKIIRIDGPLFFGAVNHVGDYLYNLDKHSTHKRDVLILGCGINFIDAAGAEMLAREARRCRMLRSTLYLCEFKPQAQQVLERGGYFDVIGADNIFATQTEALARILPKVDPLRCQNCAMPLFKECAAKK